MAINNYLKLTVDGVDSYRFFDDREHSERVCAIRDALAQRAQGLRVSSYRFLDAGIPVIGNFYRAKFQVEVEVEVEGIAVPDLSAVSIAVPVKL